MKYISLFAGIGGFDLALNRLGHECVYVNEWDKYAAQTYEKNFCKRKPTEERINNARNKPNSDNSDGNGRGSDTCRVDRRSITEVPTSDIPDHDLLVGGFPCQAFSIAGKRRGFDDTRGTLFFDIARILKDKRPRHFILENVKGLLSHDSGKTFSTILGILTDLGYEYQWQVLNSKNFGVPQNRERVFIVGHLRGEPRPKVFPIRAYDGENNATVQLHNRQQLPQGNKREAVSQEETKTTRYPLKFLKRNQRNIAGDYSFTIDSANTGGVRQGMRVRRLTPIECERLQGFPDNWTEGVSDTQRYKQLGNAVSVPVVYAIAERMFK